MPCLLVLLMLAFPRVVLVLMFLMSNYLQRAYTGLLIPILGFGWRIRVEEASLAARFGAEYEAYRSRRWALVPPLW